MSATDGPVAPRAAATRLALALAFAGLIAGGLWISLHYSLAAWKADSDIYVTAQLWRGVRDHGLGFLRTWGYTEDNWVFSLTPLTALAYEVFGPTPRVAVMTGWLVFTASAGLTAALGWRLAGPRTAALLAGALLFANYYAVGPIGFLAYPISHNVSMAWGLLIVLLACLGVERRSYGLCVAAAVLLWIDAVSDPWASAAIGAPLALAGAALAWRHRRTRLGGCALALSLGAVLAIAEAYKQPIGALRFLRRAHFQPGGPGAFIDNLGLAYRALAVTFNIVPGGNVEVPAVRAASVAALAAMAAVGAGFALFGPGRADPGRRLVVVVAVLSLGAVATLYLLGPPMTGLYVGRFFPNLYYFGALLAAVAAAHAAPRWRLALRIGALAYAALFIAAGAAAAPRIWAAPLEGSEPRQAQAIADQLRMRGLTYGYGAYWGTQALAVEALTGGAVTVRPVVFQDGRFVPRPVEASRLWYAPQAEPRGKAVFLVLTPDLEGCRAVPACEQSAHAQFGEPMARFTTGEAVVLVWRQGLAARLGS